MTIQRSWPVQERPREKLLTQGTASLSDAELLAVWLGRGCNGVDVMSLAYLLLQKFGSLRGVVNASFDAINEVKGIGQVKYAQLQAGMEIVRRHLAEPLKRTSVFHCAEDVSRYIHAELRDRQNELFGMLLLDTQHKLIAFRVMFTGTINAAAVYPRELVKQVIKDNAAAVILVHNHPSGIPEPSQADIKLTKDVKAALALIDVPVLDHFVVGDVTAVSMAQRGLV